MAHEAKPKSCKRTRKGLKDYTYLGCPMTKNRSPWCFRMCKLNADGTGLCGRLAPHGLKGHIQQSIEDFNKRQADSSTIALHQAPNCGENT